MTNNLYDQISEGKYEFERETFLGSLFIHENLGMCNRLYFKNCTFENEVLFQFVNNPQLELIFHRCCFKNIVTMLNCNLLKLQFSFLEQIESIYISGRYESIFIHSSNQPISGNIELSDIKVTDHINCSKLYLKHGQFTLSSKEVDSESQKLKIGFRDSKLYNLNFSGFMGNDSDFIGLKIFNASMFNDCQFKRVSFKDSNFGNTVYFINCQFHSYTGFDNCKNINETEVYIRSCTFKGFPHFNESEFNMLHISHSNFESDTSFDSLITNILYLYQNTFKQSAFFDNIKIRKVFQCDRNTLRTVKQQIQKTDNRIDYNRFKSYELQAYYKELKWKDNFKDKFILGTTWFSTGFDHSWLRAMAFTLLSGLMFYCLFLISEDYLNSLEVYTGKDFLSGYFRFLLITDFYNPLINEREFLTEPLSWLIFILGKIVIAFGIYEMIQAFRKFKA